MAYYEYTGGGYGGNYGGRTGTNYGGNYRGGNYQGSNYQGSNYRGGNYQSGGAGNYQQQQQTNYAPASRGNYGGYGAGYGSLGQLASMARAGYGAPGAYGRGGPGGGYQGGGYGMGPASGTATGYGPPPSRIGSTYGAPAIQSQRQLNAPGPISAGANYNQPDPQANAPGGELSGQPPSMMDRLMSVLGGISPVSSAQAAEAPPQTGSQDTLTPEDVQASPFKGPWTGTDTGQGRQLGAPYGQLPSASTEGQPNTNWAGYDPQAGGEAAPMAGAPPPMGTGSGWFSTAGNPLGGEAAPMGGAPPPGGGAPGAGWFSTADNPLGGEAAPMGGEIPPWNWYSRPDNFATQFEAAPPGQAVPADRVSAADQLAFSGQTAETLGDADLRGRLASLAQPIAPSGGFDPTFADRFANAPPGQAVPADRVSAADQLAFSGQTATGDPFADRFAAAPTGQAVSPLQAFAGTPIGPAPDPGQTGGQLDPNAFVGANPPGPFQRGATTFGDDPTRFQPGLPGTVAGTETPPAPGSPADIATRQVPDSSGVPPLPIASGGTIAPEQPAPSTRAAGGETAPTPRASSTAVGISSTGGASVAGAPAEDARGQGVGRETDPQYNPPPNSLAGVISNMFGGGDLGNTVSKLMLQLGIPAALIFAATRGRGGNLGLVGGQGAMSGTGRGVLGPQLASAPLFPGPGLPALAGLGLTGALVGNRLANPSGQPGATRSDHPPVGPTAPATPAAREDPGAFLTVPPGANLPMPVPHRTPLQTAQAGAQGGAVGYILERGGHPAGQGAPDLNPEFASRVQRAAAAYEAETGRPAQFGEMGRSRQLQSQYYDEFRRTGQGRAAPPGQSRHEKGMAIDVPDGDFQNWMHRNARRFGLEGLRPELNDPNHFQMASL